MPELADLLVRVQRLEDLEGVRATWLRYCNRLDAFDFDGLGEIFTEDASLELSGLARNLDGRYQGRRAIIEDFYRKTDLPAGVPPRAMTGHLSTNMQIELAGDEATTLAYFFEIVDDNLALIGTYQHRLGRDPAGPTGWQIAFLRISVRFRARLEATEVRGRSLQEILAQPV